jgi:hypothetical protein
MPLQARFYPYEPGRPPDCVGCYELAWGTNIVYIGMGKIGRRLRVHRRDEEKSWNQYRCIVTNDRRRARQIERRELRKFRDRHDRLPKYNFQLG